MMQMGIYKKGLPAVRRAGLAQSFLYAYPKKAGLLAGLAISLNWWLQGLYRGGIGSVFLAARKTSDM